MQLISRLLFAFVLVAAEEVEEYMSVYPPDETPVPKSFTGLSEEERLAPGAFSSLKDIHEQVEAPRSWSTFRGYSDDEKPEAGSFARIRNMFERPQEEDAIKISIPVKTGGAEGLVRSRIGAYEAMINNAQKNNSSSPRRRFSRHHNVLNEVMPAPLERISEEEPAAPREEPDSSDESI